MKKGGILFLLLLAAQVLRGAEPLQWQTSQLDMHAGLSDNCVNAVLADTKGFLWFGTNAGLDFYDGSNLVSLPFPDLENSVQPVVFSLAEDPSGTLWAGTSNGLYRLDQGLPGMRRFTTPSLEETAIRQMCCSKGGILWVAQKGSGLVRIDPQHGSVETSPVKGSAVCTGPDGTVYILSDDGGLWTSEDGVSEPVCLSPRLKTGENALSIARAACAGRYLFIAEDNGAVWACALKGGDPIFLPFISKMKDAAALPSGEYLVAARDGIQVLDSTLTRTRTLRPLHDNSFRCLAQDRRGGIWAGSLLEGLAHIAPDKLQLHYYDRSFAGGQFKARDFAQTPDGCIWIGSDTRGLLCLDPRAADERPSKQFFSGRNVTGVMAEGDKLWVGTIDEELPISQLNTRTGEITAFPDAGKSAYAFCRDSSGRLWVGGNKAFVVGRDKPGGKFEREIFMPTKQVCRILCTGSGDVWVACIDGKVFRYQSTGFSTYKISISNILTDISEDGDGRIIATSEGSGIWEYDAATDRFHRKEAAEKRLFRMARRQGDPLLWITGAHGIHILNPGDGRPLPLIPIEALGIDSFNYSSNFISSDGTLYAGTSDGFISFSTRALKELSTTEEAPVFSSLHILSSSVEESGTRFIRPASLSIGHKARSFEANVSLLDYQRFADRQIFWKIDGFNDWTPVQNGRFTVYDIPTGKLLLRAKCLSLSGAESPETILPLRVQPPLLLSPGAFLLYLVFFLLSIVVITVETDKRAKAKAEREHERKLLKSKLDFLTSIAHEIRTPLSLVQIPLEALIRKFSASSDGSVQENLDIMRRNSLKLTVLINELLDFRKLTDSTFQIHPEFLDIRSILKDAHRRFLPMFLQEGKTLTLDVPQTAVYCETDVRSLGRIFDNLLSNALKYSAHHSAMFLTVKGNDAVAYVENDGAVLPEAVREEIFKPFYRHENDSSAGIEGTGLGLSTSRQFASLLGGSLTMDDDLKVNRFVFTLPIVSTEEHTSLLPVVESKDRSIMVVEDDKDMALVIGNILSESYNIIYASNGSQALEKIAAGASPTLVVSDVIMPQTDGIALTKALKGNLATSHIPVILLSAEIPDVFMQESLEGGADAYLEKPFSPKKLRSTVDNLIENRKRVYEFYVSSLPSGGDLPSGRVSAMEQKFLRSIQEYVSANLQKNITLDEMAEVVCLSPSSLYKKMKEYADISPMEYVMKMRLGKAVELLKDDSISVQEVAQAVGFNTHSFFSECFKREFGMTPRQWRVRNVAKAKNAK